MAEFEQQLNADATDIREGKMKTTLTTVILIVITCCGPTVLGQNRDTADDVQNLKLQLIDLSAQEETLKLQIQQLDEALKPENIEHSLAGVGSTRPEELRAQRQRQLMTEKTAVASKLEQLTIKRTQLETSLTAAESRLYQESASGPNPVQNALSAIGLPGWWLSLASVGLFALGVLVIVLFVLRRSRRERALH